MGRFLFWVLFAFATWLFVRHLRRQQDKRDRPAAPPAASRAPAERMLACERCGLCLPESEGVREGDAFYCCEEHRRGGR